MILFRTTSLIHCELLPHLEYCSPIWNPTLQYMANSIEKVQRRATKLVYRFDEIPYEERLLRGLDLPSLQFRRHKEDIITAFKICKFYPDLKYIFSFQPGISSSKKRGRSRGACSVPPPPTAISRTSLSDINKKLFYVSLYAEFIVLNIYLMHAYSFRCRIAN